MRWKPAGIATLLATSLAVAVVGVGSFLLAGPGGSAATLTPVAATSSTAPAADPDDDGDDADDAGRRGEGGNAHSKAVRAWVTCKAAKGKDACAKPVPPGWSKHGKTGWGQHGPHGKSGQAHDDESDEPESD